VADLTEPLAVAQHSVNRAEVKPGDKAVVFGCGPIGLGIVLWLVDRGVTDVVALDVVPARRERAAALGVRQERQEGFDCSGIRSGPGISSATRRSRTVPW